MTCGVSRLCNAMVMLIVLLVSAPVAQYAVYALTVPCSPARYWPRLGERDGLSAVLLHNPLGAGSVGVDVNHPTNGCDTGIAVGSGRAYHVATLVADKLEHLSHMGTQGEEVA